MAVFRIEANDCWHPLASLAIVLLSGLLTGCRASDPDRPPEEQGRPIAGFDRELRWGSIAHLGGELRSKQATTFPTSQPAIGVDAISAIGIERSNASFAEPIYSAIVTADGAVQYLGMRRFRGFHVVRTDPENFRKLARLIVEGGFRSMEPLYTAGFDMDLPINSTMIIANGKPQVVVERSPAPFMLWVIDQAIENIVFDALQTEMERSKSHQ